MRHELGALVAHDIGRGRLAQHAAQRRVEQGRQPRIGAFDHADGLIELQRVGDAIAREGIDHQPLLVGGDDLLRGVFEIENALVDGDDAVEQRELEVQARLGDGADRLAQPHHQHLVGLIDREQAAVSDQQRHQDERGEDAAGEIEPHRLPPACGAFGGAFGAGFAVAPVAGASAR